MALLTVAQHASEDSNARVADGVVLVRVGGGVGARVRVGVRVGVRVSCVEGWLLTSPGPQSAAERSGCGM